MKIIIPYTQALNKNKKYAFRTKKVLSRRYKNAIDQISALVTIECIKNKIRKPQKQKVIVSGMVFQDSFKSDPANFIDGVFDGIKEGLGIDDRYYALGAWDWQIDKENPRIEVEIILTGELI